jgi:hypothetical protein
MIKKVALGSLIAAVVFWVLMVVCYDFQKKTEAECTAFLLANGFTEERLGAHDNLLAKGLLEELPLQLEAGSVSEGNALLKRHRAYAYWSAVGRGVMQVALVVLLILGLRELARRITVPRWIYQKLWSDPD